MKKQVTMIAMAALVLAGTNEIAYGGETSLAGYLTYWDGSADGVGGGVKLRKKFLGFFSADVRASYVDFSDLNTSVVPLEATVMVGFPFVVEPYAGLGASYYIFDTDIQGLDNGVGGYGVIGLQFNLFVVGALAEL
ncbi:MAG: hypothetical protein KAH99_05780, partial [Verrucomicrobia bacterium]|nr:hypothetical protein [Verrucomicrobiota bacterium]